MWEDEKMWEDVRRWGEDGRMRRCEDEKMWRWEDVKMWRWEDVKMRGCEDEKMWRWEDVKMRRCEDERMWRWEDVKMRGCEDEKMWRWEDVLQAPTIGRTLRERKLELPSTNRIKLQHPPGRIKIQLDHSIVPHHDHTFRIFKHLPNTTHPYCTRVSGLIDNYWLTLQNLIGNGFIIVTCSILFALVGLRVLL